MTTKVTVTFSRETLDDCDGDTSYLQQDHFDVADPVERAKYKEQDAQRLAAYRKGDWNFVGIRAKAMIRVNRDDHNQSITAIYELTSPGIFGIESDSDESHFAEAYAEECSQLKDDIEAMKHVEFK